MQMTPAERVAAVLSGKEFDVCPAVSITSVATVSAMERVHTFFPAAHIHAQDMAELAAAGHDFFGFDSVAPYFSIHLEASALGAQIDWGDRYHMPRVRSVMLESLEDLNVSGDALRRREMQQLLKAIQILHRRYAGNVPVIGKVIGPWTLAYHLRGVENLLIDTILNPEETARAIEVLAEVPIQFAQAQFDAGAQVVVWADHVTSDLVSARLYEEIVLPVHRKAMQRLRGCGTVILHTCGNVADRLALFADAGFPCFHMDSRNDIADAVRRVGDRMQIVGCVNNPVTLSQGTRGRVRREVEKNIESGVRMIAPECAIPMNVSADNLRELVETAHRYSYDRVTRRL